VAELYPNVRVEVSHRWDPPSQAHPGLEETDLTKGKMITDQGSTEHPSMFQSLRQRRRCRSLSMPTMAVLRFEQLIVMVLLEIASHGYVVIAHGSPNASSTKPTFSAPTSAFDVINYMADQVKKGTFPAWTLPRLSPWAHAVASRRTPLHNISKLLEHC
jgi:hypothetical protein